MIEYFDKYIKMGYINFKMIFYNRLVCGKKTFIITANPETLMIGKSNREFNTILCDKETIITPDGIGVVKGANQLGYQIKERVTGVDIVNIFFQYLIKKEVIIFIWGKTGSFKYSCEEN